MILNPEGSALMNQYIPQFAMILSQYTFLRSIQITSMRFILISSTQVLLNFKIKVFVSFPIRVSYTFFISFIPSANVYEYTFCVCIMHFEFFCANILCSYSVLIHSTFFLYVASANRGKESINTEIYRHKVLRNYSCI
jgi:hypothetical protein